jgi:DNA-binding response OmpR family regulator
MDSRHVLVVVEDPQLGELLLDALTGAGHTGVLAESPVLTERFDVAIVDLDTRARDGAAHVERLRRHAPATAIVALLPCGGLPHPAAGYHLALEKPMRLGALLAAVTQFARVLER